MSQCSCRQTTIFASVSLLEIALDFQTKRLDVVKILQHGWIPAYGALLLSPSMDVASLE